MLEGRARTAAREVCVTHDRDRARSAGDGRVARAQDHKGFACPTADHMARFVRRVDRSDCLSAGERQAYTAPCSVVARTVRIHVSTDQPGLGPVSPAVSQQSPSRDRRPGLRRRAAPRAVLAGKLGYEGGRIPSGFIRRPDRSSSILVRRRPSRSNAMSVRRATSEFRCRRAATRSSAAARRTRAAPPSATCSTPTNLTLKSGEVAHMQTDLGVRQVNPSHLGVRK